MSKVPYIEFVVTKKAFHDAARMRPGERFQAPEDFKASWAVPADQYAEPSEANTLLDKTVKELDHEIKQIDDVAELRRLLNSETSGARRKSVIAKLQDRIANALAEQAEAAATGGDDLIN